MILVFADQREKERDQRLQEARSQSVTGRAGHATETTTTQSTQSADGSACSTVTKTERLVQSSMGWAGWGGGGVPTLLGPCRILPSAPPPQLLCHSLPVLSLARLSWEQDSFPELSLWLAQSLAGDN